MQKRSSKSESTRKTEQNRSGWNFFTTVKVNGQRSKSTVRVNGQWLTCADVAVWRHLGLTWQEEKQQLARVARVARECAWTGACGRVRRVVGTSGARRHVWCSFWPFLVGFCSGLAVLSFYACCLAVECTERWYPSVASTVGVTAVARFWQWRLDEGEGSGRTPEMSTETRKSEEWLWYHVNNIKWERDWIVCILMCV